MQCLELDDFSDLSAWSVVVSGQARLDLVPDAGPEGGAMRLDFDFGAGGGFVVARRPMRLSLPDSFTIRLRVRAQAPANAFEFKLIDPGGRTSGGFATNPLTSTRTGASCVSAAEPSSLVGGRPAVARQRRLAPLKSPSPPVQAGAAAFGWPICRSRIARRPNRP
jgi:hypothetical protein